MEAQTDIQAYLEQGKLALAQGQARESAIAYAHAAQIEPNNPMVHLGLAEANLALGSYGVVYMAARKVEELQPQGGVESTMAKALLNLLDRRYDRALQDVDTVISQDPGMAYAHALRSYLLRATGHDYDAQLARARAARLSYGGHFDNDFPPLENAPSGYRGVGSSNGAGTAQPNEPYTSPSQTGAAGTRGAPGAEPVPTWSRPNVMQRQVIRTRFALSQRPRIVTYTLIAINVIIFIIMAIQSQNVMDVTSTPLFNLMAQDNLAILRDGQFWRIFTAMFAHLNILHIGLNMLSLFFIGPAVEVFFGKWRYLVIYFGAGIIGGIATLLPTLLGGPDIAAAGASGAIFGVFGALGVFFFANRRVLGGALIGQWVFWLAINIFWDFSQTGIGIQDHIGGLIAGIILGLILMPRLRPRRRI
ncbi:MAG TPA: rhomboid family intramembrane serine protease [Ktedonobacteraceae bacterium]|nr:rhomboid family intramembrane serine protease [Ktedonobacteraceae bacterium]